MSSKFLVPILLADLTQKPTAAEPGFIKLYLQGGNLRLVRPDDKEYDLVLDRKLEAYQKAASYRPITPNDTVRQAIALLEAKTGGAASFLEKDVKAIGTSVGGVKEGQVLTEGMSLTEIVERFMTNRVTQGYQLPTASWRATPFRPYWEVGFRQLEIKIELLFSQNDGGARQASDISRDTVSITPNLEYLLPGYIAENKPMKHTGYVKYAAGAPKPDNFGVTDPSDPERIQAGTADPGTLEWRGVFPWFYGTCAEAGGPSGAEIYAGGKVIEPVGSVLEVPSFGEGIKFLWFAVPAGSPQFNYWFRTVLNNAKIGTPNDLFNAAKRIMVPSTGLYQNWVQDYDLYVSNYATGAVDMMRLSPNRF